MNNTEILSYFENIIKKNPDVSAAVAALQTLICFLERDSSETLSELRHNLTEANNILIKAESSVTSIQSASELFLRFITRENSLENKNYSQCKANLLTRGKLYLEKVNSARKKIATIGHKFILDGSTILTHSRSRVVYETLLEAGRLKKRFRVYITESCPDKNGLELHKWLQEAGIPSTVILDAAAGYILEKVDFVLIGAEGVVENGGVINKIGTFPIAVCARAMNKPVYVLAESFKFVRLYPLNQQDVPNEFKYSQKKIQDKVDLDKEHPMVDYTPPSFITLLFSDLGILTPSAVSDELIKLYL